MIDDARQIIEAQGIDHAVRRLEAVLESMHNSPRFTSYKHVERLLDAVRFEVARMTGAN